MALLAGVMPIIYVGVVREGELVGDFAPVDFDIVGNVDALKEHLKASRSRLRGVELGDMTVFGPWWAFDDIPADVKDATKGRGRDPAATLSTLVDGKERAYFIVRITAPLPATAAGASAIAIVGLPQ